MSGLLSPDVEESITGSAEILEIFKVSKVGKVAGSKVTTGEISQDSLARVIRDGTVVFTGKQAVHHLFSVASSIETIPVCP